MRVLVAGATGTLGQELVRALHARGHQVVGLARDRRRLEGMRALLAEACVADATKPIQLVGCFDGVDVAVSAVGLVGLSALGSRQTHKQVDLDGNLNLLDAARRSGVRKFVYVSAQHADPDAESELLRAKGRFERALRESGLDWLVVRPTVYFEQIRQGILEPARRGVVMLVGDGDAKVAPVHPKDVAEWIADHLDASREVVPLGGPREMTYEELARMAFQATGKPPRIVHVPPRVLRATAALARPLPGAASGELEYLRHALTHDLTAPPAGARDVRDDLFGRVGDREA